MSFIASKIFKYRSYTPIPFLIVMFFFANPNIWSIFTGLGIALAGEAIRIWGVSWAGSETRTTGNVGGSFLVISGPFAHVRNPLYVGNILMYTGLGIMSFALFPYLQILGLIFYYFQYKLIVQEEELYLEKTYGKDYENYRQKVPSFFPALKAYKVDGLKQPEYILSKGLRSEKRSLQAFGFVAVTILLLWFLRRL
ncbi:MAG: protein-S-isoprenylcysteine methyltransferase [Ignavibacteria bacterium RIFOXYB2_FULL_35_12]|nr:MAG: protein-S-isoprenylcysteine methyltransferase [Ignavibacteria bacterium GWA2_36_19]OGU50841.1 MAG: protein-S-isoprenylcysteine methyltransferase [Ignavibacteria bacterium GWC2_35_8]OGU58955.1 MAG: protein-S-isoprenylcysteine methyltransferase [Ignavibacteria bacterium GWF2_35_20]OGU77378.1 MAG: protein-S-isoprenylcysteine methyltransferase [Ignavibacteria bacterium RBG_16_35_7]OGU86114.1 MAG: protein-S-isoprenylcysteine methyltransferase [Ignavibacteria bacterium RIFOXYA12_FULL_35_25]O